MSRLVFNTSVRKTGVQRPVLVGYGDSGIFREELRKRGIEISSKMISLTRISRNTDDYKNVEGIETDFDAVNDEFEKIYGKESHHFPAYIICDGEEKDVQALYKEIIYSPELKEMKNILCWGGTHEEYEKRTLEQMKRDGIENPRIPEY